jgi:prepilin-type N-terminal cleavage/methylation domain-containing protein
MKLRNMARQTGFTLVEIAIVLVIVGILLVGVLQGQEMIDNSKAKGVVSEMKAYQAAYSAYLDRYRTMPGDDTAAVMTTRGWAGGTGGNGDGVLAWPVATTFPNAGAERNAFWRAMRGSGLMGGDPNSVVGVANLPKNSAGGLLSVANGGVYGVSGQFVCASGLSTKLAMAVDILIDGPLPANQIGNNVGSLLGATGAAPLAPAAVTPAATAYVTDGAAAINTPWTVCMKIGG